MKTKEVVIPAGKVLLRGELAIPVKPKGIIIFSHGSGSSRMSPRNRYVATVLYQNNFATLLFDLLTEEEDRIYENRFDIDLLAERLIQVTRWIHQQPGIQTLPAGYFGASTGSASAIKASVEGENNIAAIVSRGGRPDLVMEDAGKVKAAVLLIVGGSDEPVIEMNNKFYQRLTCVKHIEIVPGATHLFEEEGKLEEVAELSARWFRNYLRKN